MTIDITTVTQTTSKHIEVTQFNETTTIRSLIIGFQSNLITLYVDCKEVAKQDMEINFSKLYFEMEEPIVKLFRERKYPLHIDAAVDAAIARSNCEKRNKKSNRRFLKDNGKMGKNLKTKNQNVLRFSPEFVREKKDGNKKRDTRHWHDGQQNDRPATPEERINDISNRRGDIPIMSGIDCDDAVAKGLSELYAIIKQLRDDVAKQGNEIQYLKHLMENCAACHEPTQPPRATCENSNPCYHGVQCYDSHNEIRCGHCPRGYVGDGRSCKPGYTCADRPCFS